MGSSGLTDLICAMCMATPDVGLTAVFDWVPVGVGREESITATKVSA